MKKSKLEVFENVFDAIIDDPAERENIKLRAELMVRLVDHIEHKKLTQKEAASVFGVTQPRVSDLMRGKIDLFSLDTLVNMATSAGMRVALRIKKAA